MSDTAPEVVVLSFHSGRLVGGGHVYRLSTPGGTTFVVAAARGRVPDLDGVFDDPTPDAIERVLRRNDQLHWARVSREGIVTWHPLESEARLELGEEAFVVCYGVRRVPDWLRDLGDNARIEVVLRMGAAAGLDVSTASLTSTSALLASPEDGTAWSPGRHLGTGLQGLWAWSTENWQRAVMAAAIIAMALWAFAATVTAFGPKPLAEAMPGRPGVGLPGSGLPPLELNPCTVLRQGGQPSVAAFCDRVVELGWVEPDLWYIAGNTTREIRADIQGLHLLSERTEADVDRAWAPVLSALFGKLLLVEYMPPEWGVDATQPGSPFLGPTRLVGASAQDFADRFALLLDGSERWQALWDDPAAAPDPVALHQEIFGRRRTLRAHGELVTAVRR